MQHAKYMTWKNVGLYTEAGGTLEVNLALSGNQGQPIGDRRRVTIFEPLIGQYGYEKRGDRSYNHQIDRALKLNGQQIDALEG
jgi:hypothetical protein